MIILKFTRKFLIVNVLIILFSHLLLITVLGFSGWAVINSKFRLKNDIKEIEKKYVELKVDQLKLAASLETFQKLGIEDSRILTITAYTNRPEETDSSPNITATGKTVYSGLVAVSQDLKIQGWSPKKAVMIQGLPGIYQIDDFMGPIRTNKKGEKEIQLESLDIFFFKEHHHLALQFGKQKRSVLLIDPNSFAMTLKEDKA